MKKLIYGLFVGGIAIFASGFTNVTPKTHFTSFYYVQTTNGNYEKSDSLPNDLNCVGSTPNACWREYSQDKGTAFNSAHIPTADLVSVSSNAGIYPL